MTIRSSYGFKQDKYSIPKKNLKIVPQLAPRSYRVGVTLSNSVGQNAQILSGSTWVCQINPESCELTANDSLYIGSLVTMKMSWDQLNITTVEGRVVSSVALPTMNCVRDENGVVKKLHKIKVAFSPSAKDQVAAFVEAADEVANSR